MSANRRPYTDPLERDESNAVIVDPTLEPSISAKAATNGKDPFDAKTITNPIPAILEAKIIVKTAPINARATGDRTSASNTSAVIGLPASGRPPPPAAANPKIIRPNP